MGLSNIYLQHTVCKFAPTSFLPGKTAPVLANGFIVKYRNGTGVTSGEVVELVYCGGLEIR